MKDSQEYCPQTTTRTASLSSTSDDELAEKTFSELPEGGVQGWLTLVGSMLVQFTGIGYLNAFGVYQDFYLREYLTNYSPSAIGWIGGVQLFLVFSLGLFSGRLCDRGYFLHLMISSTILHGVALFILSLSHQNQYYQVFLAQGICFGLSAGLSYTPSVVIVSHWFRKRRSLAIGLVTGGAALGAIVHPILLNLLFEGPVGFRNGIRISASVNLLLLVIATVISRPRTLPKTASESPSTIQYLKEPSFAFTTLSCFMAFGGVMFPLYYIQLYAIVHKVDKSFAFYLLSIMNGVNFLGRTITPLFVPYVGVFNLFALVTLASAVVVFCMIAAQNLVGIIFIAVLFGFFCGGVASVEQAAVASLAKSPNETGARMGIAFGISGIMLLMAQPIAGALLTEELRWLPPILFAGSTLLLTVVFILVARWFVSRREGSWRV